MLTLSDDAFVVIVVKPTSPSVQFSHHKAAVTQSFNLFS